MNGLSNQAVVSLGTTEREQKKAIPEAVFMLNNDIGILESLLDKTCEGIRPIMRAKEKSTDTPETSDGITDAPPLATELTSFHHRLCDANEKLREMLSRIEL